MALDVLTANDYDGTLPREGEDPNAAVVREAHLRFKKCQKWNAKAYTNSLEDYKFANGDAYNNYQWPNAIYETRGNRPTLTVNETRQHNLHIINEARQNKSGVKYRAVGNGATEDSAEVYEGIYRHISNVSNAQMAQGVAIAFQVQTGLGFTRITTDYVSQEGFEQEIYIKSIPNPWAVYLDPDSKELDGSDARYAFIFADKPRDEMEEKYPELKGRGAAANAVDGEDGGWLREDHIRECEYIVIVEDKDELIGDDEGTTILRSEAPAKLIKQWEAEAEEKGGELKRREVIRKKVKWYKIAGDMVIETTDLPGCSIPIVPWVGEVTVIDNEIDRKGHTRAMIGAQQMLNYNWSAAVEYGALQIKTPWVAPAAAIEGYETYWRTANIENHSILPYNHRNDMGDIPPPDRAAPPASSPAYMEGAVQAHQYMLTASGQYEAELGQPGNEKSGTAINARQRQADRATYHFVDNQALAIRRQGQIILEWVPEIYDTKRVIKILGEDDEETHVQVDPMAEAAHLFADEAKVARIFNPNVGKYEVVSDVGPDYATQRQEAFDAIVQILTSAPQLIGQIGDLLFKVADFPLADKIAERLKPGLPPEAQAAIQQLQTELQKKNKLLGEAMQGLAEERLKVKAKYADEAIKAFDSDTKRLDVIKDMIPMDPRAMQALIHQTVGQSLQDNLGQISGAVMETVLQQLANGGPPGAAGQEPIQVPNLGEEAARPGGADPTPTGP